MEYVNNFISDSIEILDKLDFIQIEKVMKEISIVKNYKGRIFFLGVGGSAANASHAVNDFRKIANIECYCPTDNVSELTARTNDDGWESIFEKWLEGSKLNDNDVIFILSVGGGNLEKNVSTNLIKAIDYAKKVGADVLGIVSRDGGYTLQKADACILIPVVNERTVTPHAESMQSLLLHLIVSSPLIAENKAKWEGLQPMKIK
jgi:D-sedoheptulose 7-phosphate isomerase